MIVWTIEAAQHASIQDIVVSTDCHQIEEIARKAGVTVVRRPPELSTDEAETIAAVRHAVSTTLAADTVVLLQPTSPLRTAADIQSCLQLYKEGPRPVVSTVAAKPWLYWASGSKGMLSKVEIPENVRAVEPNGAVYVCSVEGLAGLAWWDTPMSYTMPASRSVDIDTLEDFELAEALLRARDNRLALSSDQAYRMAAI